MNECQLVGRSVSHSINQSINQSINPSIQSKHIYKVPWPQELTENW